MHVHIAVVSQSRGTRIPSSAEALGYALVTEAGVALCGGI